MFEKWSENVLQTDTRPPERKIQVMLKSGDMVHILGFGIQIQNLLFRLSDLFWEFITSSERMLSPWFAQNRCFLSSQSPNDPSILYRLWVVATIRECPDQRKPRSRHSRGFSWCFWVFSEFTSVRNHVFGVRFQPIYRTRNQLFGIVGQNLTFTEERISRSCAGEALEPSDCVSEFSLSLLASEIMCFGAGFNRFIELATNSSE